MKVPSTNPALNSRKHWISSDISFAKTLLHHKVNDALTDWSLRWNTAEWKRNLLMSHFWPGALECCASTHKSLQGELEGSNMGLKDHSMETVPSFLAARLTGAVLGIKKVRAMWTEDCTTGVKWWIIYNLCILLSADENPQHFWCHWILFSSMNVL